MSLRKSVGFVVTLVCLCLGFGASIVFAETSTADIPLVNLEVPIGSTVQVHGIAEYVSVFYRFAVSAVAIIAATMIMYAGISWLTAAGNATKTGEAKERILAAISGLIITMLSFVILNTINPQLVELQNPEVSISIIPESISSLYGGSSSSSSSPSSSSSSSSSSGTGSCALATSGPCTTANLDAYSSNGFGAYAARASAICYAESGGTSIESRTDVCTDGNAFSVGLFQVNFIANGSLVSGCNPKDVFNYSGGSPGLIKNAYGSVTGYNCSVKDKALYATCKAKFMDPLTNIQVATILSSNGTRWGKWSTNNTCGFPK